MNQQLTTNLAAQSLPLPVHNKAAAPLSSQALLGNNKEVAINHNGALYRLSTTKLGKLILTK